MVFQESDDNVSIVIPQSRYAQFVNPQDGRRWGQAFYDFMQLEKVTGQANRDWCDRLYNAGYITARKMVHQVLDPNN